jgi:uncharacterized tellurite resistance protein B-like protein
MIRRLLELFELPGGATGQAPEHQVRLAAAALLVETARADFAQDGAEETTLAQLLIDTLALSRQEIDELIVLANDAADEATSLYEFTRVINDHYSAQQKLQLIESMWRVAYADGNLDKYEEHLIRRVAELTYVAHEDYIGCKLKVKAAAEK